MNPDFLIPIAVLLAFGSVGLWSCWSSTTLRHAGVIGAVAAPLVAFAIPPIGLACFLIAVGDGWAWALQTAGVIGVVLGLVSAVLAVPSGLVAGLLGRGFSLWLFPQGSARQPCESLAAMSRRFGGIMTIGKALFIVVLSSLLFAVLGGGVGFALGTFVPGFYRDLYRHGHTPQFDPVGMGIGLGVGQGFLGGAMVGIVLVGILAWYNLRRVSC
jgi:hypothetical protein